MQSWKYGTRRLGTKTYDMGKGRKNDIWLGLETEGLGESN